MEFIFEFIFDIILECVLDGSIEAVKSSKIPKYIRYPLIGIISLCFIAVIGLIFVVGVLLLKENILAGILLISVGCLLLITSAIKLRKTYLTKRDKEQS